MLDQDFRDCITINFKRIKSDNGGIRGIRRKIIKDSLAREMKNNNNKPHLVELFKVMSRYVRLDQNMAYVYTAEMFHQMITECLSLQSDKTKKPATIEEEKQLKIQKR